MQPADVRGRGHTRGSAGGMLLPAPTSPPPPPPQCSGAGRRSVAMIGGGARMTSGGVGLPRRRHTPIPVPPPRIPSPMPPPFNNNNNNNNNNVQSNVVTVTSRLKYHERTTPSAPQQQQKYLDDNNTPWINPRLYAAMGVEYSQYGQTPRVNPRNMALTSHTSHRSGERSSGLSSSRVEAGLAVLDPSSLRTTMNGDVFSSQRMHHRHVEHTKFTMYPGTPGISTPQHGSHTSMVHNAMVHGAMVHHSASIAQSSTAAAFFARAAQKLNLSSPHRRKRHSSGEDETTTVALRSDYSGALQRSPPPLPPALLRRIGVREVSTVGKVKVMLRVASTVLAESSINGAAGGGSSSFFSVDTRRKQVTLFDPAACGGASSAPEDRRVGVAAPKMFAFDAIFTSDDSQSEVCASALTDVIHAVINGSDGCLFCFGHARLGKTYTMLGGTESANSLGVAPCAISWLFRGINEQKQKSGARFSVRVSAVEVAGQSQQLRDLLAGHANDCEQSPGVYLRDDPLLGAQLQQHSELRVPTAERAAFYLDAAVAARTRPSQTAGEEARGWDSHFLYTLHVYQYSVDRSGKGGVAGGRSRLHLLDLGSCERGRAGGGIPLSGIANVLLAIFNGQKHLPYREHKVTQMLKECLGSLTCHVAMVAHVSPLAQHYPETLSTVQLAARIHRMRRRRIKFGGGSTGSGGSSGEDSRLTAGTSSSDVDPSSSEQSADTVIYVGPCDDATDGEHPPVYIPSLNSGDNRCAMGKALRGSGAERPRGSPAKCKQASSSEGSPARSIGSKVSKIPIRPPTSSTPKSPQVTRQNKNKTNAGTEAGKSGKSDEQWIDGPRISRSKVAEARSLLKESHKRETWVDGPQAGSSKTAAPATTAAAAATGASTGYGYMDNHKKNMIQRWVENQTVQIMKATPQTQEYKELTVFKTCDDEEPTLPAPDLVEELPVTVSAPPPPRLEEQGEEDEDEEEGVGDIPPPLPLLHNNKEINIDVSLDSFDVRLRILQEGRMDDEVEIIEVEEPEEPVPMQDSCLQVTEEDIALCMGEFFPPLTEEDGEEHPLRVLSQENLTVVSTFTDSLSVTTDLERGITSNPYSGEELGGLGGEKFYLARKFDQLAKLHEIYRNSLESVGKAASISSSQQPSRCQSISLSEMLYGSVNPSPPPSDSKMCSACRQVMSRGLWYPALAVDGSQLCSQHLEDKSKSWYTSEHSEVEAKPQAAKPVTSLASLRHPDGASNPNLDKQEERRFPGNGASTSDHEEEVEESRNLTDERTVTGKSDDEEAILGLPAAIPSTTLPGNKTPRLTRLFAGARRSPGKSPQHEKKSQGSKKKASRAPSSEGYDSGLDSVIVVTTRASKSPSHQASSSGSKRTTSTAHCESSGYESVQRDSECSSIASSHESNDGAEASNPPPPTQGGKKQSAGTSTSNTQPTGWWRLFPSCARNRMRTPAVDW